MFRRSKAQQLKSSAVNASELALRLAQDRRFRKRLTSAIKHGSSAGRRTRGSFGLTAALSRLASDQALRTELQGARGDLQQAYQRLEAKRRKSRLRKVVVVGGLASLAGIPKVRQRVTSAFADSARLGDRLRTSRFGGSTRPQSLEDLTKEELYTRAQDADIAGRSEMSKDELIAALRGRS